MPLTNNGPPEKGRLVAEQNSTIFAPLATSQFRTLMNEILIQIVQATFLKIVSELTRSRFESVGHKSNARDT